MYELHLNQSIRKLRVVYIILSFLLLKCSFLTDFVQIDPISLAWLDDAIAVASHWLFLLEQSTWKRINTLDLKNGFLLQKMSWIVLRMTFINCFYEIKSNNSDSLMFFSVITLAFKIYLPQRIVISISFIKFFWY